MRNFDKLCQRCGKECECDHLHPKEFLAGAIIGGVVGAAAALLMAPKSGEELREDIADKVQEISENTHDFADDIHEKGKRFANNASSGASSIVDQASDVIETITDEIQNWKDRRKGGKIRVKETIASASEHLDDILDWASLGIRLWQSAKRRR
jgi:gas vesicle protein